MFLTESGSTPHPHIVQEPTVYLIKSNSLDSFLPKRKKKINKDSLLDLLKQCSNIQVLPHQFQPMFTGKFFSGSCLKQVPLTQPTRGRHIVFAACANSSLLRQIF